MAANQALALTTVFWLAWPVPETARIASPFGYRFHPTLGIPKLHMGVDLSVPQGTEVKGVEEGVVRRASDCGGALRPDAGGSTLSRLRPGLRSRALAAGCAAAVSA